MLQVWPGANKRLRILVPLDQGRGKTKRSFLPPKEDVGSEVHSGAPLVTEGVLECLQVICIDGDGAVVGAQHTAVLAG